MHNLFRMKHFKYASALLKNQQFARGSSIDAVRAVHSSPVLCMVERTGKLSSQQSANVKFRGPALAYMSTKSKILESRKTKRPKTAPKEQHPNPWVARKDPEGSGRIYYWNTETNETTALDAPRPSNWVPLKDPKHSGEVYWWNPETDETTPLGASKPANTDDAGNQITVYAAGVNSSLHSPSRNNSNNSIDYQQQRSPPTHSGMPFGPNSRLQQYQQQHQHYQQQSLGGSMVTYFTWGVGLTFAMITVRAVFGF